MNVTRKKKICTKSIYIYIYTHVQTSICIHVKSIRLGVAMFFWKLKDKGRNGEQIGVG